MPELSIQMCRAARGFLGWSQVDLAAKSGLGRATITAFEGGTAAIAARSLRDIAAAFDKAGVVFLDPVEGVHQGAVGLKWGSQPSQVAASGSSASGEAGGGSISAAPAAWDEG